MFEAQKITFHVYSVNVWENAHIVECSYSANYPEFGRICLIFVHWKNGKIVDYVFTYQTRGAIGNLNGDFQGHVHSELNEDRVKGDIQKAFLSPINDNGIVDPESITNFDYVYDEYD